MADVPHEPGGRPTPTPGSVFFNPDRRTDLSTLVGRNREVQWLVDFVNSPDCRLMILKGRRKVGKSSLVLSFLKMTTDSDSAAKYGIGSNCIPLFEDLDGVSDIEGMSNSLGTSVQVTFSRYLELKQLPSRVKRFQRKVQSLAGAERRLSIPISAPGVPLTLGIDHTSKGPPMFLDAGLRGMIDALSIAASQCDDSTLILVIDEAQEALRFRKNEVDQFFHTLRYATSLKNMKVILTGSEIRLVDQMTEGEFSRVMYGRPFDDRTILGLTKDSSTEFLRLGFAEIGLVVPESLVENVLRVGFDSTGGIPGGLVQYGLVFSRLLRGSVPPTAPGVGQGGKPADQSENLRIQLAAREAGAESAKFVDTGEKLELDTLLRAGINPELVEDSKRVASAVALQRNLPATHIARIVGLPQEKAVSILDRLVELRVLRVDKDRTYTVGDRAFERMGELERTEWRLANLLYENSRFEDAIRRYSLEISESAAPRAFPDAYFNRALTWRRLNGYYLAARDLQVVFEVDRKLHDAYFLMGDLYQVIDEFSLAMEYFRKGRACKPDYEELEGRISYLEMREKMDKPGPPPEDGIPGVAAAYHAELATYLSQWGNLSGSATEWELAIRLDSLRADYYDRNGVVLGRLNHTDEAVAMHRKATELEPTVQGYLNNLGYALAKAGRFEDAFQTLERAVDMNPKDVTTMFSLLEALALAGRDDDAMFRLQRAMLSGNLSRTEVFEQANRDALYPESEPREVAFLVRVIESPQVSPVSKSE